MKKDYFMAICKLTNEIAKLAEELCANVQGGRHLLQEVRVYPTVQVDKDGLEYIAYDADTCFSEEESVLEYAKKLDKELNDEVNKDN